MSLLNKGTVCLLLIILVSFVYSLFRIDVYASEKSQCKEGGYTVVYVNGILTSEDKARDDTFFLSKEFEKRSVTGDVKFTTGYNPSHFGGIGDVIQAASQALLSPITSFDRDKILRDIHSEIKTQKILLVGHSQGTFYTNEIYNYLIANGVPKESVGVYNLATPASLVEGNGKYLTSTNDSVIEAVRWTTKKAGTPEPLRANTTLPISKFTLGTISEGHSFTADYLSGTPAKIIGDISWSLDRLSSENTIRATDGCFNPPAKGVSDGVNEVSFFVLDYASNKTISGVKTAQKHLKRGAKIAKTVFDAAKMTVEAGIDSFAEVIFYFSEPDNRLKEQSGSAILAVSEEINTQAGKNSVSEEVPLPTSLASPTPDPALVLELQPELEPPLAPTPPPPLPEPTLTSEPEPAPEPTPAPPVSAVSGGGGGEPTPTTIIGGGGGTGAIITDNTAPDKPVITSPTSFDSAFSTTTITFSGTVENGATVSSDFSSATYASTDGTWTLALVFDQGTTTVAFYATDEVGNKGTYGTIVDVGINALPEAPTITSPVSFNTEFATSSITFSGAAEAGKTISQDFSADTTTVAGDGSWSLTLSGFNEGTTTVKFYSNDGALQSSATSVDVGVDTTTPTFSSFAVLQCTYSLRTDACLSGSEGVNLSWSSAATDVASYKVYKDGTLFETTTNTSTTLSISDGTSSSVEVVVTDDAGNAATSSSQTVNVSTMPVVINEIAWAGTQASSTDEWIELYNRTSNTVDLSSVKIASNDGVPLINLSGTIAATSYFLIERTDDDATSVSADLTAAFSGSGAGSGLSNTHEELSLIHVLGGEASTTLDSTPSSSSCSGSWCGGSAAANPFSMERVDPDISGSISTNWKSNNGYTKNGTDSAANSLNGTPKSQNSVNLKSIGYYCPPQTSTFASGGFYTPTSGTCTYLSSAISGTRYGDLYRGTIASSTIVNGHNLGTSAESVQNGDDIAGGVQGEDFFVAIYETRTGPAFNDLTNFRNYFQSGSANPPHLNYGILEWKYGTTP